MYKYINKFECKNRKTDIGRLSPVKLSNNTSTTLVCFLGIVRDYQYKGSGHCAQEENFRSGVNIEIFRFQN